MIRSFVLENLKPFSINSTYYGGGSSFVKTTAAREWMYQVFHRLSDAESEQKFKDLREAFKPEEHGFEVCMIAYYPRADYMTKKGHLSNKTLDLTNCEKSLVDCLFLSKHALTAAPYGCQNLQIDDRYVVSLQSKKLPCDGAPRIEVSIELVSIPKGHP